MNVDLTETKRVGGVTLTRMITNKTAVSAVALMTAVAAVSPAWATIDNTVTVRGTPPGGPVDDTTNTASETVDVENADPQVVVTKTATGIRRVATPLVTDPIADPNTINAAVGDVIVYTYTFLNDGNVTITDISLSDAHEGNGTLTQNDDEALTDNVPLNGDLADTSDDSTDATANDGTWDSLAPGDLVTFTSTYAIVQADINDNGVGTGGGGADGDIDNTVTFSATPAAGTITPADLVDTEAVDLEDQNAALTVAKFATSFGATGVENALVDLTDPLAPANTGAPDTANVAVSDIITYTYVVTNTGNVPIDDVNLVDDVTNSTGTDPVPGNEALLGTNTGGSTDAAVNGSIDTLQPGDSATFTGTYTVIQVDIDTLQ